MPLTGPHLALPTDSNALAICHTSAFSSAGPRTVYNLIFSGCTDEAMVRLEMDVIERSFESDSRSKFVVMRDEDTGQVVSYAQWTLPIFDEERKEVKKKPDQEKPNANPPGLPDGINFPLFQRIFLRVGATEAEKEVELEVPQDQCWNLNRIGTRPEYQGKGAAKALLKWGTDQSDQEGKCCILSTNPEQLAFQTYKKAGFQVIGNTSEIDLEPFGLTGILRYVRMVRYPQKRKIDMDYNGT